MRWFGYIALSVLLGWLLGGRLPVRELEEDQLGAVPAGRPLLTGSRTSGAMTQAIKGVLEIEVPYERAREVQRLAKGASAIDLRALAAACKGDDLAIKSLVDVWARHDPQACFDSLWEHKLVTKFLFQWWALTDPDAAIAATKQIGREYYQKSIGVALLEHSPERAVAILEQVWMGSYEDLPDAERVRLTPENVAVLREEIDRIQGQSRYHLADRVAAFIFEEDPEDGIRWLHHRGGGTSDLIRRYYDDAPAQAMTFVEAEGNDPLLRAHLAWAMAKEDPENALAYAEAYPGRTDDAIQGVLREWAKTVPSAVVEQMGKLNHYHREEIWHEVLANWFEMSPEKAAEYVRGVPYEEADWDGDSLAEPWRETDLDGLAEYVASLPGDHPLDSMTESVAEKFVLEDRLSDGVAWFGRLDAADQGKALGYLLNGLQPHDVAGAEALARQSQHPDGLMNFAVKLASRDLEAAVDWGLAEGDEKVLTMLRDRVKTLPPVRRASLEALLAP